MGYASHDPRPLNEVAIVDEGTIEWIAEQVPPPDLSDYVLKETGKGLSTNDYTTAEKNKLAGIEAGAQVNANITKSEIEAKLTGEVTSHSHAGGGGGLSQQQIEGII